MFSEFDKSEPFLKSLC